MSITHVNKEDVEGAFAALQRDGTVIIDQAVDEATCDAVLAELRPHLDAATPGGGMFLGRRSKRVSGATAKAPTGAALLTHPTVLALCDRVLLKGCDRYQLTLSTVLEVWDGGSLQPLHRDEDVYGPWHRPALGTQEILISTMWALTDFTAANGGTRLIPGSHTWPRGQEGAYGGVSLTPDEGLEQQTVQVEMKRGSVALWLGQVLHGMAVNTTEIPRTGFVAGYTLGWLRQEENQYLAVPPEVARTLPPKMQELLGYERHNLFLGQVNGVSPMALLSDEARERETAFQRETEAT